MFITYYSFTYYRLNIHHLLIVNSLQIPFIVIFTKIDLITEMEMKSLIQDFKDKIASFKILKNVICMKDISDVELFARNLEENVLPVFQVNYYLRLFLLRMLLYYTYLYYYL